VKTDDAPKSVAALVGADGVVDVAMFGRALHVTVEDLDAGARTMNEVLQRAGRVVHAVAPVAPSLEDVFVSLVRAEGGAVVG